MQKKHLLIYQVEEEWPHIGKQTTQEAVFLYNWESVKFYRDNLLKWVTGLTDIQIYVFDGTKFVLIERWADNHETPTAL